MMLARSAIDRAFIGQDTMETRNIFWMLFTSIGFIGFAVSLLALALTFNPGALVSMIFFGVTVGGSAFLID
jgi:hypothetical protein